MEEIAIAWVRNHASEYGIDKNKIGIAGFSAGGTVAASAAFNYTAENKPDFIAPIYPFFPPAMVGTIPADAPPLFVAAATDDGLQLAPHSVNLYQQWLSRKTFRRNSHVLHGQSWLRHACAAPAF